MELLYKQKLNKLKLTLIISIKLYYSNIQYLEDNSIEYLENLKKNYENNEFINIFLNYIPLLKSNDDTKNEFFYKINDIKDKCLINDLLDFFYIDNQLNDKIEELKEDILNCESVISKLI